MSDLQNRLKDALDECAQLRKELRMKEKREESQAAKASAQTRSGGNAFIPADEGAIGENINCPSYAPYSPAVPSPGTPLLVTCLLGVSVFSALLHCISW